MMKKRTLESAWEFLRDAWEGLLRGELTAWLFLGISILLFSVATPPLRRQLFFLVRVVFCRQTWRLLPLSMRLLRARILNLIPMVCIALGVTVVIAVTGVMAGYEVVVGRIIRSFTGDLVISLRVRGASLEEIQRAAAGVSGVKAAAPERIVSGLVQPFGEGGGLSFFTAKGIDWESERAFDAVPAFIRAAGGDAEAVSNAFSEKDPKRPPAILGAGLARAIGAKAGDRIRLFSVTNDPDAPSASKDVRVAGLFSTGYADYDDHAVLIPMQAARALTVGARAPEAVRIRIRPDARVEDVAVALKERFRDHGIRTWWEADNNLFASLALQQMVWRLVLFGFFAVSGLLVLFVLVVRVREYRKSIGVLRSVGATAEGIAGVFLAQGLVQGIGGAILGLAAGWLFLDRIEDVRAFLGWAMDAEVFPREIYRLDQLPALVDKARFAIVGLSAIMVGVFASILPALRSARMEPVEALRGDLA